MDHSLKTGLSFGLTSAIITPLGLMVGLHSFSGSKTIVLRGILTSAIADACSDARAYDYYRRDLGSDNVNHPQLYGSERSTRIAMEDHRRTCCYCPPRYHPYAFH